MKFIKTIKDTFYNPSFYKQEKDSPFRKPFWYFVKISLIAAFIITIFFSVVFVPTVSNLFSPATVQKLTSSFPETLTVTLKSGRASSNINGPYAIPVPPGTSISGRPGTSASLPAHKNMVVIDTETPFVFDNFKKYDTYILLTADYIVGEKDNGQVTVQPLKGIPDITINRAQIISWASSILPLLKFIIPLLLLGVLIGVFIGSVIGHMIVLLVLTLIVWIIEKIRKSGLGYGTLYKLGLYAFTPLILLSVLSFIFNLPWYIDWAIYLVLILTNIWHIKTASSPSTL